jgi:hypothetical protein
MVDLSYLFSFADFSLTEFIFGEDKNKKNSDKKEDEYNDERKENIYNDDKRNENNYQKISEIAKDKIFTELFLQKLIIEFSDVLLIVIGQLTFAEQKLLNRIKKNLAKNLSESKDKKAQKIFIIQIYKILLKNIKLKII